MDCEKITPAVEVFQNLAVDQQRSADRILDGELCVFNKPLDQPPLSLAESHQIAFPKLANRGADVRDPDTILIFPVGGLRGVSGKGDQIA